MTAKDRAPPRSGPLAGSLLGRYRLVHLLGEGGMGAVYEATHVELGKRSAVKTLHERYADSVEARQRFLREGQAAARIRHPNVADVYDVGIEGDRPYLVMELLEGEDLAHFLAREAPLSVQQTADLLVPVVAALAAAHDLGVVHRDLKPENIFLCSQRHGVQPKVLDFGISKLADGDQHSGLTESGALLGTPHYMSPEQAQGKKQIDARSDQYSLGVIAYQCVTGHRPFHGVPLYVLIQRTVQGDVPAPSTWTPGLPRPFEALIQQAMARQPEQRHPSTRAFGRALLEFASERTRADHREELAESAGPERPLPSAKPAVALASTLGESVHERPVSAAPAARRRGPIAALFALAALVLGLSFWQRIRTAQRPLTSESSALATQRIEPPPAPQSAPAAEPRAHDPAPGSEPVPAAVPALAPKAAPAGAQRPGDAAAGQQPARPAPPRPKAAPRKDPRRESTPPRATPPSKPSLSPVPAQPPASPAPPARPAALPTEDPDHGFIPLDGK